MLIGEEECDDDFSEEEVETREDEKGFGVTINTIVSTASINTIKIKGTTKKKHINILIDSGYTHNFIDPDTLRQIGYTAESTHPLIITVVDGNKITSDVVRKDFQWKMQRHSFQAQLRVLPLGGCAAVLGVD